MYVIIRREPENPFSAQIFLQKPYVSAGFFDPAHIAQKCIRNIIRKLYQRTFFRIHISNIDAVYADRLKGIQMPS